MTLIDSSILATARRQPDAIAVVDAAGRPICYRSMATWIDTVASLIRDRVPRQGRVAVSTSKTPQAIIGMIAALRAGTPYVPVDPTAPAERRLFILRDAGCAAVMADQEARGAYRFEVPVIDLPTSIELDNPVTSQGACSVSTGGAKHPDDEAYVLYTSGSTGIPKGVVITHRNAASFVNWASAVFPLQNGDQIALHAPLHFDLPVYDLYVGLAGGATVHLVDERTALFPQALHRFLTERQISHLYAVPSALTALVKRSTLPRDGLPHLRQLLYAGEEFWAPALQELMRAVPRATVSNLYGPIETNVITSYTLSGPPQHGDRIPIGRPVDGVTVALLGEDGTVTDHGSGEGELLVAGDPVTPGYLGRPDLTARSRVEADIGEEQRSFYRTGDFARRDAAGLLHLMGRKDGLVKTRGYRVELGEIEAAISTHPDVSEVAIVAEPDPELTNRLHALVVSSARKEALVGDVLDHCRSRLPTYMVPQHVHVVLELPKTSTGKIARADLTDLIATLSEK